MNDRRLLSVQGLIFLIMGLLSLGVLNLGQALIRHQQQARDLNRHQQRADELLEPLTLQWQAKSLLAKGCERFGEELRRRLDRTPRPDPARACREASRTAFHRRLPPFSLWTFQFGGGVPPFSVTSVVSPFAAPEGKRTFALAFQCLFEAALTQQPDPGRAKVGGKVLQTLFGAHFLPGTAGQYLRGTPIRVTFRHRFHWLVWDFVQTRNGSGCGFLLLIPDTPDLHRAALDQAAREAVRGRKAMAGFIRFSGSSIGDVLPAALLRSPSFTEWRKDLQRRAGHLPLERADFRQPPWHVRLGKWEVFTRLVPHSSHLAVVLVPSVVEVGVPGWLLAVNVLAALFACGLLLQRAVAGCWPVMSLLQRFSLNFSLALALPLILVVTAASAYLTEYREALVRQLEERLRKAVARIDQIRDQSETEYLAACHRVLSHPRVLEMVNRGGVLHPGLASEVVSALSRDGQVLPFRKILLIDPFGNVVSTSTAAVALPDTDGMVKFYRACMIHALRRKYTEFNGAPPPGKDPLSPEDSFLLKGYANLTDLSDAAVEIDEQDGSVEVILAGRYLTNRLHRTVVLGPDRLLGMILIWRPADLQGSVLRKAREGFERENPDCRLWVLARHGGSFRPYVGFQHGKSLPAQFLDRAFGGWALRDSPKGNLFFGARSKTLHETVLVASGPGLPIRERVERLHLFFLLLALLGGAAVVVVGNIVWERIGVPVRHVRDALEEVVAGNLAVRLAIRRNDELGSLTQAFDHMIQGLAHRARLASLVSGKALDALSRAESIDSAVRGRRVRITALVSDIRSFTTLCEAHPVREITDLLNRHFEVMSDLIEKGGGRVDRFIGDAILAVFEQTPGADPAAPLRTAIRMIRTLEEVNRGRAAEGRFPYAIGVGLADGDAVIGAVGDPEVRLDFAVLGTPMKEATMLEALSKRVPHFPVVVSRGVAEAAGPLKALLVALEPASEESEGYVFPTGSEAGDGS